MSIFELKLRHIIQVAHTWLDIDSTTTKRSTPWEALPTTTWLLSVLLLVVSQSKLAAQTHFFYTCWSWLKLVGKDSFWTTLPWYPTLPDLSVTRLALLKLSRATTEQNSTCKWQVWMRLMSPSTRKWRWCGRVVCPRITSSLEPSLWVPKIK